VAVWVKICGITRAEDAEAAVAAGASAIGVNFHPGSRRYCAPERAREIVARVAGAVPVYGVFVDRSRADMTDVIRATGITAVQLHGSEPEELAHGWELAVLRAVGTDSADRVREVLAECRRAGGAWRALFDNAAGGGSGERVQAHVWEGIDLGDAVLAGGLTPENVAAIVRRFEPFGVDTAGGVEISPGVKDHARIAEFIANATSR
jgi:phosphoribosylanthranilate isomerase